MTRTTTGSSSTQPSQTAEREQDFSRRFGLSSRRGFLSGSGATAASLAVLNFGGPRLAFSSPSEPSRGDAVVVVFLRGAADGLSLTPPIGAAFDSYRSIRPTIHLRPDQVRSLDDSNANARFP